MRGSVECIAKGIMRIAQLEYVPVLFTIIIIVHGLLDAIPAKADIKPDNTLGSEGSVISNIENNPKKKVITGGAKRGKALFHSFSRFSIKKNHSAYFENPTGIKTIVSRVTGGTKSIINGVLGVLGNADLFFINPSGIIFGKGASLDTGGSFTVSTADSINFEEFKYSASQPRQVPILKVKAPIGLSFNGSASKIVVRGEGHNVTQSGSVKDDVDGAGDSTSGLRVKPGKSIALIGGDVDLIGGLITSPSGWISVAAIQKGEVLFQGKRLQLNSVEKHGNITFTRQSLVDTSGRGSGNIYINGNDVILRDASLAINSNSGTENAGTISITANSLVLRGPSKFTEDLPFSRIFARGIISQTYNGKGASIKIDVNNLLITDSTTIASATFGNGEGGSINILAGKSTIGGGSKFGEDLLGSIVTTTTVGNGKAGDISYSGESLLVKDGGLLVSVNLGTGLGGDIDLNIDKIVVDGGISNPSEEAFISSSISSFSTSSGDAGNLKIGANDLIIKDGGRVDSSTFASGNAGSIEIDAESILITGKSSGSVQGFNPSSINSSGSELNDLYSAVLEIEEDLTGDAGDIRVTADSIELRDGGTITVANDGTGAAGELFIDTSRLELENGTITASNNGGGGGITNISSDIAILRSSEIRASANNNGDGGNVNIDSGVLVGDSNSYITANSSGGFGGQVKIVSDGIIFPSANITASSDRGATFNGSVQINSNNYSIDPQLVGTLLPIDISPLPSCNPLEDEYIPLTLNKHINVPMDIMSSLSSIDKQPETQYYLDLQTQERIPLPSQMIGWVHRGDGTAYGVSRDDLSRMNSNQNTSTLSSKCFTN